MVPAVIPLLLLMIPAMLTALSVVQREGARLDHQFLRDAGDAAASSCSASRCPMSLLATRRTSLLLTALRRLRLPGAVYGQAAWPSLPRRSLYVVAARRRMGLLVSTLHDEPDRGDLRHGACSPCMPAVQYLRHDRPGLVAAGRRRADRADLSRPRYFMTICARHLLQGPRFPRSAGRVSCRCSSPCPCCWASASLLLKKQER